MKLVANNPPHISTIGGRRAGNQDSNLPFTHIEMWTKLQVQGKAYYYPHDRLPPQTINAAPPSDSWPHGQCDAVIINLEPEKRWPSTGLSGKSQSLADHPYLIKKNLPIQAIRLCSYVLYSESSHRRAVEYGNIPSKQIAFSHTYSALISFLK